MTCIETFIRNRPTYVNIVHDDDGIDSNISRLVNDFNLYKQAKDLFQQLKPVATALDRLQSDKAGLADACHEWLLLMENDNLKLHMSAVRKRFDQAIQAFHFLAYILHPAYRGEKLSEAQNEAARVWCLELNPDFLPLLVAYETRSLPFPPTFYSDVMLKSEPTLWWNGVFRGTKSDVCNLFSALAKRLLTAPASSASIERIFSSFGWVHNKIRNQLGTDTAKKLVFCYRMLRGANEVDTWVDRLEPQFFEMTPANDNSGNDTD